MQLYAFTAGDLIAEAKDTIPFLKSLTGDLQLLQKRIGQQAWEQINHMEDEIDGAGYEYWVTM